ncbi:MAG TPA: alpha-galactosidase [archaeon]|nr:alpha-galactosidase [archaeon]
MSSEFLRRGVWKTARRRITLSAVIAILSGCFLLFSSTAFSLHAGKEGSEKAKEIVRASLDPLEGLVLENERIWIKISDRLVIKPALKKEGRRLSLVSAGETDNPAFHLAVGGLTINNFRVDWEKLLQEEVNDCLGRGMRFHLKAYADQYGGLLYKSIRLEADLTLSFYEKFPCAVISSVKFTNLGKERLELDKLVSNYYRLDRRLLDPEEQPWRFASYQGAALRWGRDYSLIWITPDFDRRNFMGLGELASSDVAGGGVPLIDLWAPGCGLAVMSAEPSQQWISMPVRTAEDGRVEISIAETPEARLKQNIFLSPGVSYTTIRTAAVLHELDFYEPISVYAELLRAQGVKIPTTSPKLAYEPYWKSWGLRMDFTLDQIYDALRSLKRIGISWANLDDGWFTWYGDWNPNPAPGKFPGGEKDMIAFVSRLHTEGFKTSLWWYPQGVSPESDLARAHPEWLVRNEDGSLPLSKRGLYYLCPVQPECIEFIKGMTRKILVDWGYDGLYLDTQDQSSTPPCFNPAHNHSSPLESFSGQPAFYEAIYRTAQEARPGYPVEMCICSMPHDPFKMPFFNVASASDPINLYQVRRRVKAEKAFRGPTFCVGDCYQVPMDEWEGFSVPESFESAMGAGAQVTTFYTDLTPEQEKKWKRWLGMYRKMGLAWGEYLNLYDIAFDKPEAHVVRKDNKLYFGFFADQWSRAEPLVLRGLEQGKTYRVRDYANNLDLGRVSGDNPVLYRAFKDFLLIELTPLP